MKKNLHLYSLLDSHSVLERGYHGDTESRDYRRSETSTDRLDDKYSSLTQNLYDKPKPDFDKLADRKLASLYDTERLTKSEASRFVVLNYFHAG